MRNRSRPLASLAAAAVVALLAACVPVSPAPAPPAEEPDTESTRPILTGITPDVGPPEGGTVVQIHGLRLTGATSVKFGAEPAAFTVDSDDQITATAPAHDSGYADISVTSPGGTNSEIVLFGYGPFADLRAEAAITRHGTDDTFTVTARMTNDGPEAVAAGRFELNLVQDHAVVAHDALVPTGTFTSSGTCTSFGDPAFDGTASWGLRCTGIALAAGESLEVVFDASYAATPQLTNRVRVADHQRADSDTANNEARQQFLP